MIKIPSWLKRLNIWLELQTIDIEFKINQKIKRMSIEDNLKFLSIDDKYSNETLDYLHSKIKKTEDKN